MHKIRIKRIYDAVDAADGFRVLVDRVWPRGVRKDDAALDLWMKDIAPSTALRKWFNHDMARWATFSARYRVELEQHAEELRTLKEHARKGRVTLLFGAKDIQHNQAVVLADVLNTVKSQ